MGIGIHPSEFGAKEEDVCRVVNPYDEGHQRACGAVSGSDTRFSQIEAQQELSDCE